MNLKDLINKAKDADVDVTKAPSFEDFKPQKGEDYVVTVENVKGVTSKAGNPGLSFLLRIIDGPDGINRTIFENIYFADVHENIIARNLHYTQTLGVSLDDLEAFEFPVEPGGKNGIDFPFEKVTAGFTAGYRKGKDGTEWPDNHYKAADAVGPTVVVSDTDDDELSWDD